MSSTNLSNRSYCSSSRFLKNVQNASFSARVVTGGYRRNLAPTTSFNASRRDLWTVHQLVECRPVQLNMPRSLDNFDSKSWERPCLVDLRHSFLCNDDIRESLQVSQPVCYPDRQFCSDVICALGHRKHPGYMVLWLNRVDTFISLSSSIDRPKKT